MGRGKIEIKRIENPTNRQVTFSKRRGGLLKKAHELGVLCDVQIGLVIFSTSGKMFEYSNPPSSMRHIIDRYQKATNSCIDEHAHEQQMYCEMTRMRQENDKLVASMKQYVGEDLAALNLGDLKQLEDQLEMSVTKVRNRKEQLLHQQIENLRRKEHILEEQNKQYLYYLQNQAAMDHQQAGVGEPSMTEMQLSSQFEHYFPDEPRNLLQLSPQFNALRLQPAQPNLQDPSLHGHGLQLW